MPISNRIYPYDHATSELSTAIVNYEINQRPLLNLLGKGKVTRHGGAVRNLQGNNPLDQGYSPIFGSAEIDMNTIRETDIPEYIAEIREMGKAMAQEQSINFIAGLNQIFDHSQQRSSNEPDVTQ